MKYWLIRYPDQTYSRPVSELLLKSGIEEGQFGPKDEICQSEGYWFQIQDVSELRKQLGDLSLDFLSEGREQTETTLSEQRKKAIPSGGAVAMDPETPAEPEGVPRTGLIREHRMTRKNPILSRVRSNQSVPPPERDGFILPDDEVSSIWSRLLLILVLILIFSGTIYLLWAGSK